MKVDGCCNFQSKDFFRGKCFIPVLSPHGKGDHIKCFLKIDCSMFCNSNWRAGTEVDKSPISGCLAATKYNYVAKDYELLGAYITLSPDYRV